MAKRFGGPINLYHTVDCQCEPCIADRATFDADIDAGYLAMEIEYRQTAQSDIDDDLIEDALRDR